MIAVIYAYLLVNLASNYDDDSLDPIERISTISEVKEACRVYGTYDLVILLEAADTKALKEVTLKSIRNLEFVENTITMISLSHHDRA